MKSKWFNLAVLTNEVSVEVVRLFELNCRTRFMTDICWRPDCVVCYYIANGDAFTVSHMASNGQFKTCFLDCNIHMCSLRARFAVAGASVNQLHGSDTEDVVASEVAFFFPMQHTVAVIKPDAFHTKGLLKLMHDV